MLVLTRKLQEQIRIGDNVTITVLRVKGQSVRIGIEAPREVRVVRAELPRDGKQAATPADTTGASSPAEAQGQDASDSSSPGADEQPPAEFISRRLPQRRMINRYGAPPLRLACSHALAAASE